ncbi:MAG: hypothetical protein ACREP9_08370 [Candidatus Dormibacteraceae bacterium]
MTHVAAWFVSDLDVAVTNPASEGDGSPSQRAWVWMVGALIGVQQSLLNVTEHKGIKTPSWEECFFIDVVERD